MRIVIVTIGVAALAACSVLRPVEPFSEGALYADAEAYVAHRYGRDTLGVELRADLAAAGYACEPDPSGGHVCSRSEPAGPGCADVFEVRLNLPHAFAVREQRCRGVVAPP